MILATGAEPLDFPQPSAGALRAAESPCAAALSGSGAVLACEDDLARLLQTAGPAIRAVLWRKYATALRETEIDDVLSIALHRVWKNRSRFDPARGSLRAWFFCIAERAALDVIKSGWQKARALETVLGNGDHPALCHAAPGESPGEEIVGDADATESGQRSEVLGALLSLLEKLPAVQRQIVWADALGAAQGGVSSEQLGKEFGLPGGTVRVYRKRAMDRLRAELLKLHPGAFDHAPRP
jgi:RNA polymerase sigma-70 factor (ECF subfamily)